MKKLALHPLFLFGLLLRLVLVLSTIPAPVLTWYVPFLDVSTRQFSLDPWSVWLNLGGSPAAFPYGFAMWLGFLPLTLMFKAIGLPLTWAYGVTLLTADIGTLLALRELFPRRERLLLAVYWLSPIVILASYALGYNDIVPVFCLILSLYFIRNVRLLLAGAACCIAISAKLSMVLALPFFLIYLFHNRSLRQYSLQFALGFATAAVLLGLPFVLSPAGVHMLFSNPEMAKVYRLAIDLGSNIQLYLVPLVYLVMLYLVWRVRRLNFDLFLATMGIAFLLVVLLTPASPGWFVWTIPLLVSYQAKGGRVAIALVAVFSALFFISALLMTPLALSELGRVDIATVFNLSKQLSQPAGSLLYTVMIAVGVMLGLQVWRETVSRNDYFRLSRKPFVIGIAGDSGAGKDTFSDALKGLFGTHSVTLLSGDDYHLWDRQKPMWQVMTHLNPMANDLEGFAHDLIDLTDGKAILSRHYDHQTGKMSRPHHIKSGDFIIATGLHALYLPILRQCYNLSIYLDIDEGLRRYFKVNRDVNQRGHSVERVLASFEKREPDSVRFIRPQSAHADLVLSLQPIHPRVLEELNSKRPLRFKLVVVSRHGLNEMSLVRMLTGVCGLHVDIDATSVASEVRLTIEGENSPEDVALAAQMIVPRIMEFLDLQPVWQGGVLGLMQLVTLAHINQALTKRFI